MKSSREPPIPSRRGQGVYYAQQGTWNPLPSGGGSSGVSSFQGRTGAVTLLAADVGSALGYTAADASHSHGNVTTSAAGFMSAADKTKLDGVATGATANDTDANLKNRANHTGTQAAGTITGLASIATSGSAADLGAGTIPAARMPAMTGDATSSAGAVALSLATVNSNVGTFGNSTTVPVITVNAKGLVTAVSTATISGGSDPWTWSKLGADVANSTVTLATGNLSFTAAANTTYIVEFIGTFTSAATTTGIAVAVDIPSGSVTGQVIHPTSATALGATEQIADAATTGATTGVRAATTNVPITARWIVAVGASGGTVTLQFRSEVAASAVTLKANLCALGYRAI